jgi:succinate dehydrogenase hydrophobic anchor subunit
MSDTAARQHQTRSQRRLPRWLTLRNTRLVSGLILFAFVATHLANHALGLMSIETMEAMRDVRVAVTRSLPGTALLMLAAIVHAVLGVEKIVSRRLSAISVRGLIQIGFGLLIPVLLARHLIGTRIAHELYGINDNYDYALWAMWPGEAWRQAALIVIVWVHGCIGCTCGYGSGPGTSAGNRCCCHWPCCGQSWRLQGSRWQDGSMMASRHRACR